VAQITVSLDDAEVALLDAEASRKGVGADELARRALVEYLERSRSASGQTGSFEFIGMLRSDELCGERAEELLAGGFGQWPSWSTPAPS